ncbi:MAG: hypothetical protein NWF07_16070 [Candidatus Bathyarchaeota archaeon]|nr:hypothetical protein [Candidatus Bathyarchaeota archaeon]
MTLQIDNHKKLFFMAFLIILIGCIGTWIYIEKQNREENIVVSKAEAYIIDNCGVDYYEKYFRIKSVQRNNNKDEWAISVIYNYDLEIGNYTTQEEVSFLFNSNPDIISSRGIPDKNNVMPFNISKEQAIKIATNQTIKDYVQIEAQIQYKEKIMQKSVNKYLWTIVFYHTSNQNSGGEATFIYIDPNIGQIEGMEEAVWVTT